MQIKIFNIPIGADESIVEEMNHFLRANKIIDIKRELAIVNGNSCWTFCVTYMLLNKPVEQPLIKGNDRNKVDYKELLEPEIFEKFSLLRKIRKQVADEEAIPAYAVFTDSELASIAQLPEISASSMLKIPGIGKKKVEKYADAFCKIELPIHNEEGGILDGGDSES